jgi:hypothetical protein
MWIKQTLGEQRKILTTLFEPAMSKLAKQCAASWTDIERLDQILSTQFSSISHCHLLYAIDKFGKQVSSNVTAQAVDPTYRDQDLSRRPYSVSLYPKRHFMLSSVYISQITGCPCISAVQPVVDDEQQFLGFVVADFDIRQLPLATISPTSHSLSPLPNSIGNFTSRHFPLRRASSPIDRYLSDIQSIVSKLVGEHGVFHCTLHYSSAQAMLWQVDDPYQYYLYGVDQLLDPNMSLVYSRHPYSARAKMAFKYVKPVLERFNALRLGDDSFYLRSGSVNIMNGTVGLTFSYEGTQYMPFDIFLNKDLSYWIGQSAVAANAN